MTDKLIHTEVPEEATPDALFVLNGSAQIRAAMASNALYPDKLLPTLDVIMPLTDLPSGTKRTVRVLVQFGDSRAWVSLAAALATLPTPHLFPEESDATPEEMAANLQRWNEKKGRTDDSSLPN